jgi:hypothetical protein
MIKIMPLIRTVIELAPIDKKWQVEHKQEKVGSNMEVFPKNII